MTDIETARKSIAQALQGFRRRAAVSQAYHAVYATEDGRRVLFDLMRRAGMLETAPDPSDSRFYEGRRSLALEIVKELRWTEAEMMALAEASTREELERLVE
jgi:hypothetical protein